MAAPTQVQVTSANAGDETISQQRNHRVLRDDDNDDVQEALVVAYVGHEQTALDRVLWSVSGETGIPPPSGVATTSSFVAAVVPRQSVVYDVHLSSSFGAAWHNTPIRAFYFPLQQAPRFYSWLIFGPARATPLRLVLAATAGILVILGVLVVFCLRGGFRELDSPAAPWFSIGRTLLWIGITSLVGEMAIASHRMDLASPPSSALAVYARRTPPDHDDEGAHRPSPFRKYMLSVCRLIAYATRAQQPRRAPPEPGRRSLWGFPLPDSADTAHVAPGNPWIRLLHEPLAPRLWASLLPATAAADAPQMDLYTLESHRVHVTDRGMDKQAVVEYQDDADDDVVDGVGGVNRVPLADRDDANEDPDEDGPVPRVFRTARRWRDEPHRWMIPAARVTFFVVCMTVLSALFETMVRIACSFVPVTVSACMWTTAARPTLSWMRSVLRLLAPPPPLVASCSPSVFVAATVVRGSWSATAHLCITACVFARYGSLYMLTPPPAHGEEPPPSHVVRRSWNRRRVLCGAAYVVWRSWVVIGGAMWCAGWSRQWAVGYALMEGLLSLITTGMRLLPAAFSGCLQWIPVERVRQ